MYERITDENPYEVPMRIYPAAHYTMGGLWVDYNLMTTIAGLYAIGEANFSDHGANRLGRQRSHAGSGRRLLRAALHDRRLPGRPAGRPGRADRRPGVHEASSRGDQDHIDRWLSTNGTRTVDYFHRELGKIMIDQCGMERNEAGLEKALAEIPGLREEFRDNVRVLGTNESFNQSLEKAQRVDDFFELAELMCHRRARP